jgi:amidase
MAATMSLPFSSAVSLREALMRKELSACELLDLYLSRIERHDPALNLIVTRDEEGARKAARAADDARAHGKNAGPLAGLPMTIKDSYEVAGMTATCGLPALANHKPARDADAVARLRKAGAIFFGKTNLPAGAADWQSYNDLYGRSNNPWDVTRTPGGSSGGAAGAVAAGFTSMELGSDIGGSIRVPSHFCGVFGLKPSYGVVPMRGHIPPPPGTLLTVPLGVGGPIARSAADLRLALEALAGTSDIEGTAWRIELPPSRHARLKDFRVGVWLGGGVYVVDDDYRRAIEAFVQDVRRAGAKVTEAKLPFDAMEAYHIYLDALFAVVGAGEPNLAAPMQARAGKDETGYAARLVRAMRMSLADWLALSERRERLFRAFKAFFADYDVLLCPAATVVAFPHDTGGTVHADQLDRRLSVNGKPRPYFDNFMWPSIATCSNLPAAVMPTGRSVGGLPAGVQIIGPYLEDFTVISFASLVEAELGGFAPPPALAKE